MRKVGKRRRCICGPRKLLLLCPGSGSANVLVWAYGYWAVEERTSTQARAKMSYACVSVAYQSVS